MTWERVHGSAQILAEIRKACLVSTRCPDKHQNTGKTVLRTVVTMRVWKQPVKAFPYGLPTEEGERELISFFLSFFNGVEANAKSEPQNLYLLGGLSAASPRLSCYWPSLIVLGWHFCPCFLELQVKMLDVAEVFEGVQKFLCVPLSLQ